MTTLDWSVLSNGEKDTAYASEMVSDSHVALTSKKSEVKRRSLTDVFRGQ